MKHRWDTIVEDINLAIKELRHVARRAVKYEKGGRGRNPERRCGLCDFNRSQRA